MNCIVCLRRGFFRLPPIKFSGENKRKTFHEERLVGWTVTQLYDVVSNVQDYKYFLPACFRSDIIQRISDTEIRAELEIGVPPLIKETYVSSVTLDKPNKVTAVCKDGQLFNHLSTEWKFQESSSRSTLVSYHLEFEFKSQLYSQLVNAVFDQMSKETVDAFMERTEKLYGPPVPVTDKRSKDNNDNNTGKKR